MDCYTCIHIVQYLDICFIWLKYVADMQMKKHLTHFTKIQGFE